MQCLTRRKACQGIGEKLDYAFNWTHEFAKKWAPDYPYAAAERIRPSAAPNKGQTGYEYVASAQGVSESIEPAWPDRDATVLTVKDGSLIWTRTAVSVASLKQRIQGSGVWTPDPRVGAPVLTNETTTDTAGLQETRVWIAGGSIGVTYLIKVVVTTTLGAQYSAELRLTIE